MFAIFKKYLEDCIIKYVPSSIREEGKGKVIFQTMLVYYINQTTTHISELRNYTIDYIMIHNYKILNSH